VAFDSGNEKRFRVFGSPRLRVAQLCAEICVTVTNTPVPKLLDVWQLKLLVFSLKITPRNLREFHHWLYSTFSFLLESALKKFLHASEHVGREEETVEKAQDEPGGF
jgi:hypothetical protein